eukprot:2559704-Prymnesium_polylepis.1
MARLSLRLGCVMSIETLLPLRQDVSFVRGKIAEEVVVAPARQGLVLSITPDDRQHLLHLVVALQHLATSDIAVK